MADRLLQVLAFVNVPASGSVPLPHQINVNDVPQVPDYVAFDQPGFTAVVTATQATVTNHNAAPASVNVWLELKHTVPRVLGAVQTTGLIPRPFIASGGGAGGGGGGPPPASDVLTYRPNNGGANGPSVFEDWTLLYAQLQALRAASVDGGNANGNGLFTIVFDNSNWIETTPGNFTIPSLPIPAGNWDMRRVQWIGYNWYGDGAIRENAPSPITVLLVDGATITNLCWITGIEIDQHFDNVLFNARIVVGTTTLGVLNQIMVLRACNLEDRDIVRIAGNSRIVFDDSTGCEGANAIHIDPGQRLAIDFVGSNGFLHNDTIEGDATTTVEYWLYDSSTVASVNQTSMLGTISVDMRSAANRWGSFDGPTNPNPNALVNPISRRGNLLSDYGSSLRRFYSDMTSLVDGINNTNNVGVSIFPNGLLWDRFNYPQCSLVSDVIATDTEIDVLSVAYETDCDAVEGATYEIEAWATQSGVDAASPVLRLRDGFGGPVLLSLTGVSGAVAGASYFRGQFTVREQVAGLAAVYGGLAQTKSGGNALSNVAPGAGITITVTDIQNTAYFVLTAESGNAAVTYTFTQARIARVR